MSILPVFMIVPRSENALVAHVRGISPRLVVVDCKTVTRYVLIKISVRPSSRIENGTVNILNIDIYGDGNPRFYSFKECISSDSNRTDLIIIFSGEAPFIRVNDGGNSLPIPPVISSERQCGTAPSVQ
jgi:hypothetical protein